MPAAVARGARRAVMLLAALLAGGCATFDETFREVESHLVAQDYAGALAALESQSHNKRDHVLYLLNKGMLQRLRGDLHGSNTTLEAAKTLMDELYAASVSEQALAFVINDSTRSYAGEEHERVLVHLYMALNYLELRELDAARVEALQADLRLRELAGRLPAAHYGEDAFARYLTALIYEELGEWSDALIAYRKAYEAYIAQRPYTHVEVPEFLKRDLLRLTERQGLTDERRKYQREFGVERWTSAEELATQGEVVVIVHNGLAPRRRERAATVLDPGSGHFVRLALPELERLPPPVTRAEVGSGAARASDAVVEDIAALARNELEAKLPAMTARAIARQVVKAKVAHEVKRSASQRSSGDRGDALAAAVLGLGVEIAALATERADTRHWATLPHDIRLARLALPPGRHTLRVELYGGYNHLLATREYPDIELRAGEKRYLSLHWMPSYLPARRR
jgi:hypothetical protein